jgi:hypothetical protein
LSELDEQWAAAIAEAEIMARRMGRGDVVDYLNLRATNDLARSTAVDWLFSVFNFVAAEINRRGASIQTAKSEVHSFRIGAATMVGSALTLKLGIRTLTIEAGWPRRPGDGIVKGGGLARARIRHFGRTSLDEDLLLMRNDRGVPQWLVIEKHGNHTRLMESSVMRHIRAFAAE